MDKNLKTVVTVTVVVAVVLLVVLVTSNSLLLAPGGGKGKPVGGGKGGSSQCNDHIDNDGDGFCDFSWKKAYCSDGSTVGDSDCLAKDDNDETGSCVPACNSNSNCGSNGYIGNPYCGGDGNLYRDYQSFTCDNAGTCAAVCNELISPQIWDNCLGNGCQNGACIPNSCADSDGYNPNVQGIVSGLRFGNTYSNTDSCATSTTVIEYYCVNENPTNLSVNCLSNTTTQCSNGACI